MKIFGNSTDEVDHIDLMYFSNKACEFWDGCFEQEEQNSQKFNLNQLVYFSGLTKFASRDYRYYEIVRKYCKLTTIYKMHILT